LFGKTPLKAQNDSKHKMTMFSKNVGGTWPLWPPPAYAYDLF